MSHPNTVEHLSPPRGRPMGDGNGDSQDLRGRASEWEAKLSNLATKEDIQKLKVRVLAGTIGAGVLALSIAAVSFRWLG